MPEATPVTTTTTPRRGRKSVVYGAAGSSSRVWDSLQPVCRSENAICEMVQNAAALDVALSAHADSLCLVLFDFDFEGAIRSARQVAARNPLVDIAFLVSPEQKQALLQSLGPTQRLGNHVHFFSPADPNLERLILSSVARAARRRATRTTLDRFNTRLASSADLPDVRELRHLRISDRFLSSILDSAFDAVILVDPAGIITSFNPAAERLFEVEARTVLSSPLHSIADQGWKQDAIALLAAGGEEKIFASRVLIHEKVKYLEISATDVKDGALGKIAISLIVRDVTNRRHAEETLRTTEKLAAVGRLASSIAHEINNPLEAVTNLLYLARQSAADAQMQSILELADQELRRVSAITNQTLRFHKQSSRAVCAKGQDLLRTVLGVYQGRLHNTSAKLSERYTRDGAVECFDGEIRQVLNNLVGNALDAMTTTGGTLYVRSKAATDQRTGRQGLRLTIADTGSGMAKSTMKQIFEPFFTTKGIGGTGLGLWVSKEIVDRHGGVLCVRSSQSAKHHGTVFTLFLPSAMAGTAQVER